MFAGSLMAPEIQEAGAPLRILLVDDSWEFLGSVEHFLAAEPRLKIVGYASSGQEALEQVNLLHPDLVLMDLAMPQMNGLVAARRIKAQSNAPRVVILTVHNQPEYQKAAEAAGADGFISKSDFGVQVLPLIEHLFAQATVA
jgi:DNA-binding NarL/FixJ family response regulator